jgi:hypothetical protein
MAGNSVKLEFAGDADKLVKASKQASGALGMVSKSGDELTDGFKKSGQSSGDFLDKIGKLGAGMEGISGAFGDVAGATQALADYQQSGAETASKLARANNDVEQATEDMAQATRDAKQAQIDSRQAAVDLEQAQLDQKTALTAYNDAVKEHGKNSAEAAQAQIDLKQAGVDVAQAQEDAAQATRDGSQAAIDAKTAQLDLNDAQRESNPPDLQKWADKLNILAPLLSGVTAVVGLVTAAQWLWNSSLLASPITWIVVGIAAVVVAIVLLVKHWDKVRAAGAAAWDWITSAASSSWNFLKKIPGWLGSAFKGIANVLTWPFRAAFNAIADMWNSTIGSLSWSVPGWVPGIGGNSINVPDIPRFHTGGTVPGPVGQETLAILQGGEQVSTGRGSNGQTVYVRGDGLIDTLITLLQEEIERRGGNVQVVLGG